MTIYSLSRPLEGHEPIVGRIPLGRTWAGGRTYGTTLRCSCGWVPWPDQGINKAKVTNEAPSKGGRAYANAAYKRHVEEVLGVLRTEGYPIEEAH